MSAAVLAAVAALVVAEPPAVPATERAIGAHELVLVGAGDISRCDNDNDAATARQVERVLGQSDRAWAFTLGDNVYPDGTVEEFQRCYEPTWGKFKRRTLPTVGNHDWRTKNAAGFRATFAGRFTPDSPLYYSVDVDGVDERGEVARWHVVVLDSDCDKVDCSKDGAQHKWLVDDLRRTSRTTCTLALFHHPRFSSGPHGDAKPMTELWAALDNGGVDLVLSGHDHIYERFPALTAAGEVVSGHGMPSIIVGTGGASHYPVAFARTHSQTHIDNVDGVLLLRLFADGYRSSFVRADNGAAVDVHTGRCRPALTPSKKPSPTSPATPTPPRTPPPTSPESTPPPAAPVLVPG